MSAWVVGSRLEDLAKLPGLCMAAMAAMAHGQPNKQMLETRLQYELYR